MYRMELKLICTDYRKFTHKNFTWQGNAHHHKLCDAVCTEKINCSRPTIFAYLLTLNAMKILPNKRLEFFLCIVWIYAIQSHLVHFF